MIAGKILAGILIGTERPQEALEVASQMVQYRPGNEGGWRMLGISYLQLGQPAEAIRGFHRAWQINPYNVRTALHIARASELVGDIDGSMAWAYRALELDPENARAWARINKLRAR